MIHATQIQFPPIRRTLKQVREREVVVRDVRDKLDSREYASQESDLAAAREFVELSVMPLEVTLIAAVLSELAQEHGFTMMSELHPSVVGAELSRRTRIEDVPGTICEHFDDEIGLLEPPDDLGVLPIPIFVRQARSIVAACPIEDIENAACLVALPEKGHRCRVAYDGLRAFLARNDGGQELLTLVGRMYAHGRLSIVESANLLRMSPPDALRHFEEQGFWRNNVGLTDEQRESMLEKIREDRRARGGSPRPSAARAVRSAVASSRIESVDARPWLRVPAE